MDGGDLLTGWDGAWLILSLVQIKAGLRLVGLHSKVALSLGSYCFFHFLLFLIFFFFFKKVSLSLLLPLALIGRAQSNSQTVVWS